MFRRRNFTLVSLTFICVILCSLLAIFVNSIKLSTQRVHEFLWFITKTPIYFSKIARLTFCYYKTQKYSLWFSNKKKRVYSKLMFDQTSLKFLRK